jgi:flagellar basal-body rod protein FlgB
MARSLLHQPSEDDMPTSIDTYLGIHTRALTLEARRTELLANNLANVDTPGFKARDIDFKSALSAAQSTVQAGETHADLKYRVPMAPALDGNTVDAQLEQAAFVENVVRYQATLSFINGKLRALMTAITGQ